MVSRYLDIPRAYKSISTKLKTCKKRRNLEKRLSKSVINLMNEEMSGSAHFMQTVRGARGYLSLAKKANIFPDIREVVRNYSQKVQELTFTADIFEIGHKQCNSGEISEGTRYDFFFANKKADIRKKAKDKKVVELSLKVLGLLKLEESGKIELSYAKKMARAYKNECAKYKCVGKIKEVILRHEERIQEPTITGDIFKVYYAKNIDEFDKRKMYEFFTFKSILPRKIGPSYLLL